MPDALLGWTNTMSSRIAHAGRDCTTQLTRFHAFFPLAGVGAPPHSPSTRSKARSLGMVVADGPFRAYTPGSASLGACSPARGRYLLRAAATVFGVLTVRRAIRSMQYVALLSALATA